MNAYKTFVQVDAAGRVLLENLPFPEGALVEVLVLDQSGPQTGGRAEPWRSLMRHVQGLPQSQTVSDEDIAREIDEYRSGR